MESIVSGDAEVHLDTDFDLLGGDEREMEFGKPLVGGLDSDVGAGGGEEKPLLIVAGFGPFFDQRMDAEEFDAHGRGDLLGLGARFGETSAKPPGSDGGIVGKMPEQLVEDDVALGGE